ncbi:MAG: DUF3866 family protein [Actinomycetota bacterium]
MIRIRRGTALEVDRSRPGVFSIVVEVEGSKARAIAYEHLTGPITPGDTLVLNTGAVALRLGTGGMHFVIAVEGGPDTEATGSGHAMKLRYTPVQHAVLPVEETHRGHIDAFQGLDGFPIVVASLHSALAPACIAAKVARPEAHIAFVMTDAGALPIALSESVAALKDAGLLDVTITTGQAFGGDMEAVNKFTGIIATRTVTESDVVIVGAGPGHLGTASRYGFAAIETGEVVNAVAALGGRAILAPRLSFADERSRHRGLSHHTVTALGVAALAGAEIALPSLAPERHAAVVARLEETKLLDLHRLVEVDLGTEVEEALRTSPVPLASMGRTFADDPDYFRAAAAAAVLAVRGNDAIASRS